MKKLVIALLISGIVAGLAGVWGGIRFLAAGPRPSGTGEARVFEVFPGEGFNKVAHRAEREKLITSAVKFKLLARLSGFSKRLRVGEYAVRTDLRPMEFLRILASGKSIERSFTVPEGYNILDIGLLIEQKGIGKKESFIRLARDAKLVQNLLGEKHPSLEGYLFPETYKYTKYTKLEEILRAMVSRFNETYALLPKPAMTGLTKHQLVTLASVIEKETGAPEERFLISSVFHNRLKKKMRLQSDPTILYGIWAARGEWKQNITRKDILSPTAYNTYTVAALPFGPIANPGREALLAAGNPAASEFLFFVSKNDGTHTFSVNLVDHNSAVKKFQLDPKSRQGKSWRDLKR